MLLKDDLHITKWDRSIKTKTIKYIWSKYINRTSGNINITESEVQIKT